MYFLLGGIVREAGFIILLALRVVRVVPPFPVDSLDSLAQFELDSFFPHFRHSLLLVRLVSPTPPFGVPVDLQLRSGFGLGKHANSVVNVVVRRQLGKFVII